MAGIKRRVLTFTLFLGMIGGFTQWNQKQGNAVTDSLAQELAKIPSFDLISATVQEFAADTLKDTDLAALRQINPDVIGWIMIPKTELSYPVLQGTDNAYYLDHAWNHEQSSAGSIFLDHEIANDFQSFHSILYGHRMKNGSMFGSLKYYRDLAYWKEHPSIYLISDRGVARYDIFAAYEAAVTDPTYALSLPQRSLRRDFLLFSLDKSVIHTGIYLKLTDDVADPILTLSTCTGHGYETRWVVSAVLHSITD